MYITSEAAIERIGNTLIIESTTENQVLFFTDTTECDQKFIELIYIYMQR